MPGPLVIGLDPLVLLTPRLLLRPYEVADAPSFFAVLDESRGRLATSFPDRLLAVPTLAHAPAQLAAFAHDWRTGRFYVFGIWHRTGQVYLGDICLMPQLAGQAEIGYYLAPQAEGQGYAREALGAVVGFGFGQVKAQCLLIRCFADNLRGQAVAQALGFVAEPAQPTHWPRLRQGLRRVLARPPEPDILYFTRYAPEA
ncbi:GNAT family N-acetyltransferase [Hymenobacter sp. RP-2-7]|uniref:GNAT family N-acetyltransferase n=1 Tax=Hymenobacter polaris TaxID=2682546 RepID=A0A7Y0AHM2_9BACT|nr:GNAT family N-acetyltransferase [Hymenobacter polaris]NML67352.1 GNAT family N-acetyltransferase [Hymenobacter polaris]